MATKPPPPQRRGTTTIPAKPPRLPDYVPLPPPTGRGPAQPDNRLPDVEGAELAPVQTIADEQRQRSEDIQRMGVQAYMAQFDTRDPEAKPQTVPGVQHRKVEEYEARTGRR